MNKEWNPIFQIELMDIINSLQIEKLRVGSSDSLIYETMGEPELPVARLDTDRESKIFSHRYGNVGILSANNTVIKIYIGMHGFRKNMVILGRINSWKLNDWLKLAKIKKWNVYTMCDVIRLEGKGIDIYVSPDGKVEAISLF